MTNHKYVLTPKTKKVKLETNLLKWARWFEKGENRRVDETQLKGFTVSTIFLGLDHNFTKKGKPLLFETMVFPLNKPTETYRWHTWKEAYLGHKKVVEELKIK